VSEPIFIYFELLSTLYLNIFESLIIVLQQFPNATKSVGVPSTSNMPVVKLMGILLGLGVKMVKCFAVPNTNLMGRFGFKL